MTSYIFILNNSKYWKYKLEIMRTLYHIKYIYIYIVYVKEGRISKVIFVYHTRTRATVLYSFSCS